MRKETTSVNPLLNEGDKTVSDARRFIPLDVALCTFGGMVGLLWFSAGIPFSLAILATGTLSLSFGVYLSHTSAQSEKLIGLILIAILIVALATFNALMALSRQEVVELSSNRFYFMCIDYVVSASVIVAAVIFLRRLAVCDFLNSGSAVKVPSAKSQSNYNNT